MTDTTKGALDPVTVEALTEARKEIVRQHDKCRNDTDAAPFVVLIAKIDRALIGQPAPASNAKEPINVRDISDEDMRELLSAKDVGTGRARLKRILACASKAVTSTDCPGRIHPAYCNEPRVRCNDCHTITRSPLTYGGKPVSSKPRAEK